MEPWQMIYHRKGAESAENFFFLLSAETPESKKQSAYSSKLFTIRVIPSRMTGTLKFNSNPRFKPVNFKYVSNWALWIGSIVSHDLSSKTMAFLTTRSIL
jgi:hypothetical protein